jgi:hypothetical protein
VPMRLRIRAQKRVQRSAMRVDLGIVWFRHDLRLTDHAALVSAQNSCSEILPLFVIDNSGLVPRRNQPGCETGVPATGPHKVRCAASSASSSSFQ